MRIFVVTLFLFSFCFSSLLRAEDNPWLLRKNLDGIPVYTRKVPGSPILEFKSDVIVNAPMAKAIALFEDEKQIPRWYFQCAKSRLLANEDPRHKVIYLIMHLPWPVASRDFIFRRSRTDDKVNRSITYSLTALPDRLPVVKGMIRVRTIESIWCFKSLSVNQTEILFQQHTDPAGSIPSGIINQMEVQTPFYSLMNFRKLITGKNA